MMICAAVLESIRMDHICNDVIYSITHVIYLHFMFGDGVKSVSA